MMPDYPLGETLDFKFTTRQFSSGAPFTLAAGVVEVYEDNDIAQITAGETLTADFDGVTGLNNLRIVATGGNGYEAGKSYAAILSAGTVDSVSVVGEVVAQFSIERSPALRPTTAGRTIDVLATGETPIDFDTSIGTLAAAQIEANALDGKGDWNIGKTGYSLAATGLDAIVSTATGMVEIAKAVWDRLLTGGTHNIADSAGRRIRDLQEFGTYTGGAVWMDTVNGSGGTTDFESGTDFNALNTIADVNTILTSIGLVRVQVAPGSDFDLAAAQLGQLFLGVGWALGLGNQNINNTYIVGANAANGVSGIATAANMMGFHDCIIGTASLQKVRATSCSFKDVVTQTLAGDYSYINCQSGVPGAGAPTFTKTAGQAITMELRRWSGSVIISGLEAGDVITVGGPDLGTITLNGADAQVEIRGNYKSLVDNLTGAPTVNDVAVAGPIRGTDNAALASVCTEPRLAELDAANIPADAQAAAALMTTQLTEAYAADGVAPTPAQALFLIQQMLTDFGITGTTLTVREIDGVTVAATFTLDDGTNPTDITRAT